MKILAMSAILIVLPAAGRAAGFGSSAKATSAAGFLKMGAGARATAMGNAYSAVADEASALYWNPAGLTRIKDKSLTFMHADYLESSYYDYLAYGQNLGERGAWGASAQYFSAGKIAETDQAGIETGHFTPHDMAFTLGYARQAAGFGLGVSGKVIRTEIVGSDTVFAADLGVLSPPLVDGRLRLAVGAANLGTKVKYERESEDLPLVVRTGGALRIAEGWQASLDLNFPRDNSMSVGLGTEYERTVGERTRAAGRLGYNSRFGGDADGFKGLAFGVGLGFRQWQFDYAFMPAGALGMTHRLSVSLRLGGS